MSGQLPRLVWVASVRHEQQTGLLAEERGGMIHVILLPRQFQSLKLPLPQEGDKLTDVLSSTCWLPTQKMNLGTCPPLAGVDSARYEQKTGVG
ncbi:hypothetical protein O3Q51_18290, partial [Cryomorphaceae bacterium 1068]|nr:hypothetical protein [Cryomorphaceae bacterium 1068]